MIKHHDTELVKDCLCGNTDAFASLLDKYQKPIFNVAFRMVSDTEDARDISQTVFVKAFEKLDSYNPKYKFFSWLYRMVVNESINFLNQKNYYEDLDQNGASTEKRPDQLYNDIELSNQIQNAMMHLRLQHRAVIILKHFEEFSYQEMSYILDISEKKVKSRLFSAREKLRDILLKRGIAAHDS